MTTADDIERMIFSNTNGEASVLDTLIASIPAGMRLAERIGRQTRSFFVPWSLEAIFIERCIDLGLCIAHLPFLPMFPNGVHIKVIWGYEDFELEKLYGAV